jgi:deoxyribodipyrimidine photo-lyase
MPLSLFWFRRDLRLDDNAGLYQALRGPHPVLCLFIFDREILDDLTDARDARVEFIHQATGALRDELQALGSALIVRNGKPLEIFEKILSEYEIAAVYTNRDYEPYAVERDGAVEKLLAKRGIELVTTKDHVIFEHGEVLKNDGTPYTVFTPYSRRWLEKLDSRGRPSFYLQSYPTERYFANFYKTSPLPFPTLSALGFEPSGIEFPPPQVADELLRRYADRRDIPAVDGTSRLGIHFRFGTISIRERARLARPLSDVYLKELIWRDFYSMLLAHFPRVVGEPYRLQFRNFPWREAPADLERWKQGRTGYPLVDAGMRELNATGYMHNRVRMVAASLLVKHLLIDWREGEAYFAEKLLDYELATNNGSWQWVAGTGADAAPPFRVFNPLEQARKFDPKQVYIRKWIAEYGTPDYPEPMVEHEFARERYLATYRRAVRDR